MIVQRWYVSIFLIAMPICMWSMAPTEHALSAMLYTDNVEQRKRLFAEYIEQMRSRYVLDVNDIRVTFTPPTARDPVMLLTPYASLYRRVYHEMPVYYPTLDVSCNTAFFESPYLVPNVLCAAQRVLAYCRQHALCKHDHGLYPHDPTSVTCGAVRSLVEHIAQHCPALVYPDCVAEHSDYHSRYQADAALYVATHTDAPELMAWLLKSGLISDQVSDVVFTQTLVCALEHRYVHANTHTTTSAVSKDL